MHQRALPRVRRVPRAASSDADDASYLSSSYGLTPDDWQDDVLADWLGRRVDGRWAAATCGLAVPRQNGKNAIIEVRELFGMVELGEKFLHTAHQVKTARKAFMRIAGFFENEREYPELSALVKEIRKTNGQEAVVLTNGGSVEFIARSRNSGRGFTVDVLVCDEAQDLTDDELDALLPTISVAPTGNPQVIFTGTPPDPEKGETGEVFTRVRGDGEAGRDARLAWTDYGVPDGPAPDLDDRSIWAGVNPSLATRLAIAEVERERGLMSEIGFARERLGWWGDPAAADEDDVLPNWAQCLDPQGVVSGRRVLAVDTNLDRSWSCISGAGIRDDDRVHVEMVEHRPGTAWVVGRLKELRDKWGSSLAVVVDQRGPAASLFPDVEDEPIKPIRANTDQACSAYGDFVDAVENLKVTHPGDMDAAVAAAQPRPVGDRFLWGRKNSGADITPLVAATLAAWGLTIDPGPLDDVGVWVF